MRIMLRGVSVAIAACVLAGCSGESGESTATAENPQAALDVLKKMQGPIDPKAASKGQAVGSPKAK